ncbi:MAG: hypothetical protein ACTSPB_26140 [Candidatus Thorarchaeota archaeon]
MTRITEEMIAKLSLSMIEIGFTLDDVKIALNAIMQTITLEVIANIPLKKRSKEP